MPNAPHLDNSLLVGECEYNGVVFPPAVGARVQVEPVYESSGRVPKWWKHTLTLEFVITPQMSPTLDFGTGGTAVDKNTEVFKRALTVPGRTLKFTQKGFGMTDRVIVNAIASTYTVSPDNDLNFGPKPELITWESIGSSRAVRVQWSVEFALAVCCFSDSNGDGLCDGSPEGIWSEGNPRFTEFNYSVSLGVDEEGWMTRSLIGTVEVPGVLVDGGVPAGAAAVGAVPAFSRVIPLTIVQNTITNLFIRLPGFHRTFQWDVSRDFRRLDFRITDSEIHSDNPYLNGVLKCQASHRMKSGMDKGFYQWECLIAGTFTIQPNIARWLAFSMFLTIVRSRLAAVPLSNTEMIREWNDTGTVSIPETVSTVASWIPGDIEIEEELYGREFSFSFSYTLYASWAQIIRASKMFYPIEDGNWGSWLTTQAPALSSGRGTSDLSVGGTSSIVVHCTDGVTPSNNNTIQGSLERLYLANLFQVQCPPADQSWLDYKVWFEINNNANYVSHYKSWVTSASEMLEEVGAEAAEILKQAVGPNLYSAYRQLQNMSATNNHTVQATSHGKWHITMVGYAIRACYDIPVPNLTYYGGQIPKLIAENINPNRKRLNGFGVLPVYATGWRKTYELAAPPEKNPLLRFNAVPDKYVSGIKPPNIVSPGDTQ